MECAVCGKEFKPKRKDQIYCSSDCRYKKKLANENERYAIKYKPEGTVKIKCKVCGKEFESKRKNSVCCSDECRLKRKNLLAKKWLVKHYKIKPKHKRKCEVCGVEFETNVNNKKYCCEECFKKSRLQKSNDRYCQKRNSEKEYKPREKQTYGGKRPMTPALEHFFIRFARLLKQVSRSGNN